ncbi:MAG: TonB-dependent receptor plug domain-containing protein [Kofleriaceae bacterium]
MKSPSTLIAGGLTAFLGLAAPSALLAQPGPAGNPTGTQEALQLGGVVYDASSGLPVVGATVEIDGGPTTTTDLDGRFTLVTTVGATLRVNAPEYQPALLVLADEPEVAVALMPLATEGEVIEIRDIPPPPVAGATSLSREELATLPGTGGDLLASLDALPGVTAPSGFGGGGQGVIIRGSAPEDSRILLDGFDIPQLYHFLNRSIIPTEAVAGLDYLPGGFDVRFGRASSGIVSVTSRGGGEQLDGAAEVSVIDANVLGSGPVGDNGRVLASVRRSYVDTYLPSLLPDDVGLVTAPRYYDGLVRTDWDLTPRWRGALTVVGSSDVTELVASEEQTDDQLRFRADTKFVRAIAATYWRGKDGLSFEGAVSGLAQGVEFSFDDQFLDISQTSLAARAELSRRHDQLLGLTDVIVRGGAEVDLRRAGIDLRLERGPDEGTPDDGREEPLISFQETVWLPDVAGWTAIEASLSPAIRLTTGLRVDGYLRNASVPVQPRAELSLKADERTKVRIAAGRYTRPPEYQDELLLADLDPESSTQVIVGAERRIGQGGRVQLTAYGTERTDLLTRPDGGDYRNQGRGRTIGAELLASYRSDRVFGWLSYSLSRSTRRDTPDAEARFFSFDQTHDLVAAASYKTRNRKWQFGGKFTFVSGQPWTPVLGAIFDSDADTYYPVSGDVNSERLPSHHQLDLRVDHFWRFDGWTLSAFLDVSNVYLNPKVEQYQYNFDYSQREQIENLPIVPTIGLRGEL